VLGQEVSGTWAARLGLAWEAVDGGPLDLDARVERAPQMLSFQRRAAAGARGSVHPSTVAAATS
jgi:hypothetical protein